ncbi:MAG: hypothetical protein A2W90_24020 [Bacteroidetes bacterium GWF2_42_66]|nr:MAG: hypothetical protein A2W92_16140 [Bacteroidetes bacterium GWA2_42_15]OFY00254.1 MAG: hypothetical protein A2W89_13645 [Bacteroidetes bacterium GWE2_42_39]OFY47175.1 MAG: hypothetical protein A2W90_24020 [Bacteroidetes bacterium GWF2_42_66]HBL76631.1 Crp/Fnr family transcriptional regulator [Prolixibacteraceae bacterium]HCR88918.1 Crp/Fnr family transcriptional regulator [Prolixibacteraceae bacterium]
MVDHLRNRLQQDKTHWERFRECFHEKEIPSKTILLKEGEISQNMCFVKKGCLRLWFNNDGKDITFQFFFEGQAVSSIESFWGQQPSIVSLESIEPSVVVFLKRDDFMAILNLYPDIKDWLFEKMVKRMADYSKLFLSRIKNNPQERYCELLENNPEIIQRVPQHYIASYLGITPISLSRIRNRK